MLSEFPTTHLIFQKTDYSYRHLTNVHAFPDAGWTSINADNSMYTYTNITQMIADIPLLFTWFPGCDEEQMASVTIKSGYNPDNKFGFTAAGSDAPSNSCPVESYCHLSNVPYPDSYDCECSSVSEKVIDWSFEEERSDWFAAASTYTAGYEANKAIDGDRGTCWKAKREEFGREPISSIRVSPTFDASPNTKIRGVKVYLNHWSGNLSSYEGMSVTVSRWAIPGSEPNSATEINADSNNYKHTQAMQSGNCDEYGDATFTYSSNSYHPNAAAVNWFQGDARDYMCGKSDADPYYGLQDTISCGYVETITEGDNNYRALHFHCEDSDPMNDALLSHVVQIDSRDVSTFDPSNSRFSQFDFEICEVELIPNIRCEPRDAYGTDCNAGGLSCDSNYPAACQFTGDVLATESFTWNMQILNGNHLWRDQVKSATCGFKVAERRCDCGDNHIEQPNSECGGFPNFKECAGTPNEPCEDRNECEQAYNSYYKDFIWHGQGDRFTDTGSSPYVTNEYSNIAGSTPQEGKADLEYVSHQILSVAIHGDADPSDINQLFDGDSDTNHVFDATGITYTNGYNNQYGYEAYEKGFNFKFDAPVLLDKIEVVISKSNFDSFTKPGLDWTKEVMQLLVNTNNDANWHHDEPSPAIFSMIDYGWGMLWYTPTTVLLSTH